MYHRQIQTHWTKGSQQQGCMKVPEAALPASAPTNMSSGRFGGRTGRGPPQQHSRPQGRSAESLSARRRKMAGKSTRRSAPYYATRAGPRADPRGSGLRQQRSDSLSSSGQKQRRDSPSSAQRQRADSPGKGIELRISSDGNEWLVSHVGNFPNNEILVGDTLQSAGNMLMKGKSRDQVLTFFKNKLNTSLNFVLRKGDGMAGPVIGAGGRPQAQQAKADVIPSQMQPQAMATGPPQMLMTGTLKSQEMP